VSYLLQSLPASSRLKEPGPQGQETKFTKVNSPLPGSPLARSPENSGAEPAQGADSLPWQFPEPLGN
jgi:hypothetical protein